MTLHFHDGVRLFWMGGERPAEHGERRKGWDHAHHSAQAGPLGLFNVYRRTFPIGEAMRPVYVGQVMAGDRREAQESAREVWPEVIGSSRLDVNRAEGDHWWRHYGPEMTA